MPVSAVAEIKAGRKLTYCPLQSLQISQREIGQFGRIARRHQEELRNICTTTCSGPSRPTSGEIVAHRNSSQRRVALPASERVLDAPGDRQRCLGNGDL